MSSFDAIAKKAIADVSLVFGDTATYHYSSGGDSGEITVICNLDVIEAGSIHEMRSPIRSIKITKTDIISPVSGDRITVSTGEHAGTYFINGIDDQDEYSYWVVAS